MIQASRGANSSSLLREAESALFIFENDDMEHYFQQFCDDVVQKRKSAQFVQTGAKELKTNLLSYLEQRGETKTANVWCRGIKMFEFNSFLEEIKRHLKGAGIEGVLEVHLQDREINSPHVQFVGTRAQEAEELIAQIVVKRKYETSMDSALSKQYVPSYKSEVKLQVLKTDDFLKEVEYQKQKKHKETIEDEDNKTEETKRTFENFQRKIGKLREEINSILNAEIVEQTRVRQSRVKPMQQHEKDDFKKAMKVVNVDELLSMFKTIRRKK